MSSLHAPFIQETIALARRSGLNGFDPFGALLVKDNRIVARSIDQCISLSDPTAHAELSLIRTYCQKNLLIDLSGYTLYSSTEPCLMCSGAIHWAKIERVVFSVSQAMLKTKSGGNPKPTCAEYLSIGGRKVEVIGPVLPEEGMQVFQEFPFQSKAKRHQRYWK